MTNIPGPRTTSTEWAHRLATLIHEIRTDWDEAGIRAALAQCGGQPLATVTLAAIASAIERTDQRTPAIIALDGRHWHMLDRPGTATVATVHSLACEHGERPARCDRCASPGVPCPPDLMARMRADIHTAQASPTLKGPQHD